MSGKSRKSYSAHEKLQIIDAARNSTIKAASARFGVHHATIAKWISERTKLLQMPMNARRCTSIDTESGPLTVRVPPMNIDETNGTNPSLLIGYQGESGGFADIAARRTFEQLLVNGGLSAPGFTVTGYPQVRTVFEAVNSCDIDYGIVETETLLSAAYPAALQKFLSLSLKIVGEITFTEEVSLFGLPGTTLSEVDCIMSDWRVLQQHESVVVDLETANCCNIFRHVVWDSATACRIIREEDAERTLALCSEQAGSANGLARIRANASSTHSQCKYVIVGRNDTPILRLDRCEPRLPRRQCTVLVQSNGRAALMDIAGIFMYRSMVIDYICMRRKEDESDRLTHSSLITYNASADENVEVALHRHLRSAAQNIIVLGYYFTIIGSSE